MFCVLHRSSKGSGVDICGGEAKLSRTAFKPVDNTAADTIGFNKWCVLEVVVGGGGKDGRKGSWGVRYGLGTRCCRCGHCIGTFLTSI